MLIKNEYTQKALPPPSFRMTAAGLWFYRKVLILSRLPPPTPESLIRGCSDCLIT